MNSSSERMAVLLHPAAGMTLAQPRAPEPTSTGVRVSAWIDYAKVWEGLKNYFKISNLPHFCSVQLC